MAEGTHAPERGGLLRRLLTALAGSAGLRLIGLAATFLVGVKLARSLGPEGYGVYGTLMAMVMIAAVPIQFGLPQMVTREVSRIHDAAEAHRALGLVAGAGLLIGAFALALAVALGACFPPMDPTFSASMGWALLLIPGTAWVNLVVSTIRGLHQVVSAQFYDVVLRPVVFGLALWMLAEAPSVEAAVGLHAGAMMLTLVACLVHLKRAWPYPADTRGLALPGLDTIRVAVPFAGTEVLRVLDAQYTVLLLGVIGPLDDVGVFRVALSLAAFLSLPYTLVNVVVMPYLSRFHAQSDRTRLELVASGASVAIFGATLLGVLAFLVVGPGGIEYFFGDGFAGAWSALALMGLGFCLRAYFGSAAMVLNMCGEEKEVARTFGISLGAGVVMVLALHPWLGLYAAAMAVIASEIGRGVIFWRLAHRRLSIDVSAGGVRALWRWYRSSRLGA